MATKQKGCIVRISNRWYVRYREHRNIGGVVEQKRVSHCLGDVTTRGKRPPADIEDAAAEHMATVNREVIPADRITTIGQFVEQIYLPWIKEQKRPSTTRGYSDVWRIRLKPLCADVWIKNVRTFQVQGWLNSIDSGLSRNTHKHEKKLLSSIFKVAKQMGFYDGINPVTDTAINPRSVSPIETIAYSLEEINGILAHIPEPAATAFAIAAFTGLRIGEIEGLNLDDYRDGNIYVSRSVWNGHETAPKTRKSRAAVPVIRQLAERLEMHRLRCGNPTSGPMFGTSKGTRLSMHNVRLREIVPALNRCGVCGKSEDAHDFANHAYKRDARIPEWQGWHACRRGLGSNLYRLGVSDMVIQRILRHANVNTTMSYYIKTEANDIHDAMAKLENSIPAVSLDSNWTPTIDSGKPN
jgi:integrase